MSSALLRVARARPSDHTLFVSDWRPPKCLIGDKIPVGGLMPPPSGGRGRPDGRVQCQGWCCGVGRPLPNTKCHTRAWTLLACVSGEILQRAGSKRRHDDDDDDDDGGRHRGFRSQCRRVRVAKNWWLSRALKPAGQPASNEPSNETSSIPAGRPDSRGAPPANSNSLKHGVCACVLAHLFPPLAGELFGGLPPSAPARRHLKRATRLAAAAL